MLYAMIDIGSNTVRMAIYELDGDRVEMVMKRKHTVGLAAYVKNGMMQKEGIEKAVRILLEFKDFLQCLHIPEYTAFTTAALRNARNSKSAVREISHRSGIDIRVLSGEEEAYFDFIGATHNLVEEDGLLIDIGGGSTEIVYFKNRQIMKTVSLPIGSLGFHTRYASDILPSAEECANMRAEAEATIGAVGEFQAVSHAQICGIGGTFKGATLLYNSMYGMRGNNMRIEASRLQRIIHRFQRDNEMTQQDTILLLRTVPERLHTILPGLIIADVLAKRFASSTIVYSNSGVREGFIYSEVLDQVRATF